MRKRDIVIESLQFQPPPYIPWAWDMTVECENKMKHYLCIDNTDDFIDSYFLELGARVCRYETIGENHVRDIYGVIWDRSIDKDIGVPVDCPIKNPKDLDTYQWPDLTQGHWYNGIDKQLNERPDVFSRYLIGFSLYERAWSMRGMTELLMDMVERPQFIEELLDKIVENNLIQINKALSLGVDMVHFGDDYGTQTGLIMGIEHWRHFIKPRLARMFEPVRDAGRYVSIHSCGCVSEIFDDLIEIGLNMFNPFQPEVMDVFGIKKKYQGRLAFHGGMSIQKILPFGSVEDVRAETKKLIKMGKEGGYIFAPSHSVTGDVPVENLVAMIEVLKAQQGYNNPK